MSIYGHMCCPTRLLTRSPTGMMRGFAPTLLRSVLGNAAAFAAYEALVAKEVPVVVAGGLAGLCFWTIGCPSCPRCARRLTCRPVSFPADVLKSNIQTSTGCGSLVERLRRVVQVQDWGQFGRGANSILCVWLALVFGHVCWHARFSSPWCQSL
jgi:hypothetical protein